jgi:hypothetical protein
VSDQAPQSGDEVEGHAKRFHRVDPDELDPNAEGRDELPAEPEEDESDEEPDVEGHAKRFH